MIDSVLGMTQSGSKQWSYIISLESACVLFLVLPCGVSELGARCFHSQILFGFAKTRWQVQVKPCTWSLFSTEFDAKMQEMTFLGF